MPRSMSLRKHAWQHQLTRIICCVDVSAGVEQRPPQPLPRLLHHAGNLVQRGFPAVVARVDVGACCQQMDEMLSGPMHAWR